MAEDEIRTPSKAPMKVPVIALIGPPAVGKTTLTMQLGGHIEVFRLRTRIEEYIRSGGGHRTDAIRDELGWFSNAVVADLLNVEFHRGRLLKPWRPLLLEGFPGNASQMKSLAMTLARRGDCALGVVVLAASDELLRARAAARRVCQTCEPSRNGHSRAPASIHPGTDSTCARCGGQVSPRFHDAPDIFEARLARYHANIPGISLFLRQAAVPHREINVDDGTAGSGAVVLSMIARLRNDSAPLSIKEVAWLE